MREKEPPRKPPPGRLTLENSRARVRPFEDAMADLGKKYECYNCRTKFYNLGKPDAICPKCGANQKEGRSDDAPAPAPRPPRRSSVLMEPIPEESQGEFGEESAEEERSDDEEFDETEELGESERAPREEEEEF